MLSFFYDIILLLLGLIALPKFFLEWLRTKKYAKSFKERLGMNLPDVVRVPNEFLIWIHTISVGETRAIIPLYNQIKKGYPHAKIIISNITETGNAEAKRSLNGADAYFFLPLDFSFLSKKVVSKYKPDLLILVESDFWYHLLKYAKKSGAQIALVNGKISERSFKRFMLFPFFTKALFSLFDLLCLQNELFEERFLSMGIDSKKIHVTGNIKFDQATLLLTPTEITKWREELGVKDEDRLLVIGSTHDKEEEWLLAAIESVWQKLPTLKVLLVPRHPERFTNIAKLLNEKGVSYVSYSQRSVKTGHEKVVLIDTMGLLNTLYQIAEIAIVAGSFIENIGGHNVFEPANFGTPVVFGPHMWGQVDLTKSVLDAKAGLQVTLDELPLALMELFTNDELNKRMSQAGLKLAQESKGSTERSFNLLSNLNP